MAEHGITIRRVFDAPRERVWQEWSEPERFADWFVGPEAEVPLETVTMDVRPGGAWRATMFFGRDRRVIRWKGEYVEVVAPERLVFTMAVADKDGNRIDPQAAGMDPDWPRETVVTVTFAERAGKTTLTLRQTVSEALAKRTGAHPSWISMLDRLAAGLAAA